MHKIKTLALGAILFYAGSLLISLDTFAQQLPAPPPDPPKNWHQMDLKTDGYFGVSLNQAYEFLKGKKSKTVVVTTIDSGIDTTQKDLAPILWVNPKEIPANGKDDDHDGFVDDVHGWDFLGGKDGKVDNAETEEEVRQYYKLKDKFAGVTTAPAGQQKEFAFWQDVKTTYDSTETKAQAELKELSMDLNALTATNHYVKTRIKTGI